MALLTTCQASFQSMKDYEDVKDDVESLKRISMSAILKSVKLQNRFSIPSGKRILRNQNWKQSKRLSGKHYTEQFRNPNGLHKDNK